MCTLAPRRSQRPGGLASLLRLRLVRTRPTRAPTLRDVPAQRAEPADALRRTSFSSAAFRVSEAGGTARCPRPESNQRTRFRKPLLYPLSYGGSRTLCPGARGLDAVESPRGHCVLAPV